LSGKKVLLIGMDFRNPRLNEYMVVQEQGVTNYLSSNDLDLNDLIVKHDGYKNFHILSAGAIPPNPAELLMSGKVDLLLKLEIAIMTNSRGMVTDTLLIAKNRLFYLCSSR
jgi:Mrp family chromosome partitioning ATPase